MKLAVMKGLICYVLFIIGNVCGAKLWNRLPLDMRKKDTASAFTNALKNIF